MFSRSIKIVRKSHSVLNTLEANIQDCSSDFITPKSRQCYPILIKYSRHSYSNLVKSISHHNLHKKSLVSQFHQTSSNQTKEAKHKQNTDDKPAEKANLSTSEKLKKAVTEYGSTVIVFHVGISLISLGTCYLLVSSGLDVAAVFKAVGLEEWFANSKIANNVGNFAIAYAVHKVFAPVRIGITLTSVPFIVSYLKKIGYLKK